MNDSQKNYDRTLPQLVSYPRTGSHWVRLVLEQYLDEYCRPTTFFDCDNYWGYHLHDRIVGQGVEGITGNFDKVIYLYRNPVDTIFSQLTYEGMDWEDTDNVEQIVEEYFNHLDRWLFNNEDIKDIIFVKYEELKSDTVSTFSKILTFLNRKVDKSKLSKICEETSIKQTKEKTTFDQNIVNTDHFNGNYEVNKKKFYKKYKNIILDEFSAVWE